MRILLTSASGQIGWELRRALHELGEVVAVDRAQCDLTDERAIRITIQNTRPDLIINAAGYNAVDRAESESELAMRINALAPGIIAEEADRLGAALLSYSTDYVFDGQQRTPYQPGDTPNPINEYGRTKLAGEQAVTHANIASIILRTSWVYSQRRSNFLRTMLNLAETHPELRVVNDQHGCPSWSRLIARGTAEIIAHSLTREGNAWTFNGHEGIHHLACTGVTTWYHLARHIFNCAELHRTPTVTPITTDDYPTAARRPPYSALDCTATREIFNVDLGPWEPAVVAALANDPTAPPAHSSGGKERT